MMVARNRSICVASTTTTSAAAVALTLSLSDTGERFSSSLQQHRRKRSIRIMTNNNNRKNDNDVDDDDEESCCHTRQRNSFHHQCRCQQQQHHDPIPCCSSSSSSSSSNCSRSGSRRVTTAKHRDSIIRSMTTVMMMIISMAMIMATTLYRSSPVDIIVVQGWSMVPELTKRTSIWQQQQQQGRLLSGSRVRHHAFYVSRLFVSSSLPENRPAYGQQSYQQDEGDNNKDGYKNDVHIPNEGKVQHNSNGTVANDNKNQSMSWHNMSTMLLMDPDRVDDNNNNNSGDNVKDKDINMMQHQEQQQHQQQEEARNRTAEVEKEIRVAKAKAEIDRILNSPDAPFDMETQMTKVVSMTITGTTHVHLPLLSAEPVTTTNSAAAMAVVQDSTDPKDTERERLEQQEQQQQQIQHLQQDALVEEQVSMMEDQLYKAVKEQDYNKAATIQHEMRQMHMDDCAAVLQVNAAFYRAFSDKDYRAMERIWFHDGTITCIHPSNRPLVGAKTVLASWKKMFDSTRGSFQRTWMEPNEIRLSIKGANTALISCDEMVYSRRFIRGQKRQTELINQLIATNVFHKVAGRWYLTHHHASWHPESQASQLAMRYAAGMRSGNALLLSSRHNNSSNNNNNMIHNRPIVVLGSSLLSPSNNKNNNNSNNRGDSSSDDDDPLTNGIQGILGTSNFGPLLGSQSRAEAARNRSKSGRGGVTDFHEKLRDLLSGGSSSSSSSSNSNNNKNNAYDEDDDDDDDDDLDDDDEDYDDDDEDSDDDDDVLLDEIELVTDDDDDNDDSNERTTVTIVATGWSAKNGSERKGKGDSSENRKKRGDDHSKSGKSQVAMNEEEKRDEVEVDTESNGADEEDDSAALRQDCIRTLRRLCNRGLISPKHKLVLFTDIITCSAKGELSMVEVAYDILCGGAGSNNSNNDSSNVKKGMITHQNNASDEEDEEEELEFADQCRVFAIALTSSSSSSLVAAAEAPSSSSNSNTGSSSSSE